MSEEAQGIRDNFPAKIWQVQTAADRFILTDEYQVFKIDALMALNRYKEAHDYYDETSKMFLKNSESALPKK